MITGNYEVRFHFWEQNIQKNIFINNGEKS